MTTVGFGVNTNHVGDIWALYKAPIEQVLSQVVKFIGENPTLDSNGIVSGLSNESVCHFCEPPNAYVVGYLPFLYHSLRTAKIERLIST